MTIMTLAVATVLGAEPITIIDKVDDITGNFIAYWENGYLVARGDNGINSLSMQIAWAKGRKESGCIFYLFSFSDEMIERHPLAYTLRDGEHRATYRLERERSTDIEQCSGGICYDDIHTFSLKTKSCLKMLDSKKYAIRIPGHEARFDDVAIQGMNALAVVIRENLKNGSHSKH
jgi:hypothetical protein